MAIAFVLLPAATAHAQARPNVVLIIADDLAWTDYRFMGHAQVRTPRLDRLAAESVTFRQGYVTSSLCCPSLASILTGCYPHQHRIANNDPPLPSELRGQARNASPAFVAGRARMNAMLEAQPTLPKLLGRAGYLSFQSGKWWQGHYRTGGFTHGISHGDEAQGGRHGDEGLRIGRETLQPAYDFIDLAKREQKPFFLWYAPMLPHAPHTPPERFLAHYRDTTPSIHVARYWAMIEWFDETCGQLLDYLDAQGLADDTLVIFVADNGWIQSPDRPEFAPRSKQSPYDGGLRTPILVRWPGKMQPRTSDTPVSSIDIAPTILNACGIAPPDVMPGVNLLDDEAVAARTIVFGACFTHDAVDLERPETSLRWRWCVAEGWKLIVPSTATPDNGQPELFNLALDPHETKNLADVEPQRVANLLEELNEWWATK